MQTPSTAHGGFFLEGIPSTGRLSSSGLLVIASSIAAHGAGALHVVWPDSTVRAVDDGAPTLAGVPFLSESRTVSGLLATVDRGVVVVLLLMLREVRVGGPVGGWIVHVDDDGWMAARGGNDRHPLSAHVCNLLR